MQAGKGGVSGSYELGVGVGLATPLVPGGGFQDWKVAWSAFQEWTTVVVSSSEDFGNCVRQGWTQEHRPRRSTSTHLNYEVAAGKRSSRKLTDSPLELLDPVHPR